MKNKILKLAKRLETFRMEDIESIMGEGIEDVLQELVKEGQLKLVGGIYSYKAEQKSPLPFCFKFHSQEKIEMIFGGTIKYWRKVLILFKVYL